MLRNRTVSEETDPTRIRASHPDLVMPHHFRMRSATVIGFTWQASAVTTLSVFTVS